MIEKIIEYIVKVYANGDREWFIDGKLHRKDGPAVECASGFKGWYIDGKLHRRDGPAVEYADGLKFWYLDGIKLTKEQHKIQTNPVKDHTVQEISELLVYNVRIVKELLAMVIG